MNVTIAIAEWKTSQFDCQLRKLSEQLPSPMQRPLEFISETRHDETHGGVGRFRQMSRPSYCGINKAWPDT